MGIVQLSLVLVALMANPSNAQCRTKNSGTRGGNSPGQPCVFPFIYKQVSYDECITLDNESKGNIPWCGTTSFYDQDKQWANCEVTIKANRTRKGNAGKSRCVYPFIYKGRTYTECTTDDHYSNRPWCATSANYDRDHRWALCVLYEEVRTTGGNVPEGTLCNFPYEYGGVRNFHGCITTNNQGVGWCSTTESYSEDHLWGNCVVTTTTSSGNCPTPNTFDGPATNTLSYGGEPIGNLQTSVRECMIYCLEATSPDCLGFDYDNNLEEQEIETPCYLHRNRRRFDDKTFLGPDVAVNVDQYTLRNRCNPSSGDDDGRVKTRGGNSGSNRFCSFPFIYRGYTYTSCTSRNWYTAWCSTTPNFDQDRKWGECCNVPLL